MEDNALTHITAYIVNTKTCQEKGIITFNWLFKSLDMNKIEPIWDYKNNKISTYQFIGASQAIVEDAKATLQRLWVELL